MNNIKKMKIGVLDLTCCTGCEANLLGTDASLAEYAKNFEITSWRMIEDEVPADYDVVLVEGYACNEEQVKILKQARATSAVLVAFGTCAASGNIFSQLRPENYEKIKAMVYGPGHRAITQFVKPVPKVVKVDRIIRGCPADINAIKRLLDELSQHPVTSKELKVFTPDYVARIEGHAKLKINLREKSAHFYPEEGERFIEALVIGKPYLSAPKYHSRICGICPVAHCLCSNRAIEQALEIPISDTAKRLRHLLQCGQMVQSHLLHLYFMILPSITGLRSSLEIGQRYPSEFNIAKAVKKVAEEIFRLVGGAQLHPVSLTPGGFIKMADKTSLSILRQTILKVLEQTQELVFLFTRSDSWPEMTTSNQMMCLEPEDGLASYPLFGTRVHLDDPSSFYVWDYLDFIHEKIVADKPAKTGFLMENIPVKTGALPRLARYHEALNLQALEAFKEAQIDLANPFHNNKAQAVEILHYLEEAALLLEDLEDSDLELAIVDPKKIKASALQKDGPWPKRGVSAIEAPRGVLIHEVKVDRAGNICYYNIIPPTNLNLSGLDGEICLLLERYQLEPKPRKIALIEDLVRAMDPCITCSVH